MTLTCALLLLASQSHVRGLLSILALCITTVYSTSLRGCTEAASYHHTHTYILQVKSPTSENHQLSVP